MTDLKCCVSTCCYNADNRCCRGNIKVEGKDSDSVKDTCCGSFKERTGESCTNKAEHPDKAIDVACEAGKCIYNCNMKCSANDIGIAGAHAKEVSQTECSSFRARS